MGKSYKRTPINKSCGYGSFGKKAANKRTRKSYPDVLLKGKQYKKLYNTWDINDCIVFYPRNEASKNGELENWKKWFYRK